MILIIATTLRHKSLYARKTSVIIILDKSSRNKIFQENLKDYSGDCLKNFHRIEQKLETAFSPNFPFFENFSILNYFWNLISSIDAIDVSVTADTICRRKRF